MFYYRTSFSKKSNIFGEKTVKNPFVGGHGRFERKGVPGDKNQYNLFCRHRSSKYFLPNNFLKKKKTIFSKIKAKNYFWENHSQLVPDPHI